jgi:Trp operon repressor
MKTLKRTYALPPDVVTRFERAVSAGERSAIVTSLLAQWVAERERAALRQRIIEECADMEDEYREVEREFLTADEELHRAVPE